jgi:hypothetical protein
MKRDRRSALLEGLDILKALKREESPLVLDLNDVPDELVPNVSQVLSTLQKENAELRSLLERVCMEYMPHDNFCFTGTHNPDLRDEVNQMLGREKFSDHYR